MPVSTIRILAVVLALVAADPVRTYKKELGAVGRREKVYAAKGLDDDLRDAYEVYRAPFRQRGGPDAPKVIDYDFSGYAGIYERFADYADEKGRLAVALAGTNDRKAAETLFDTLLDVLSEIDRLDREILAGKPKTRSIHDLTPGIRRYAAWIHRDAIVAALGTLTEEKAVAALHKTLWTKAGSWDKGHRSARARAALVDALGRTGRDRTVLETFLEEPSPAVRIAALEAVAGKEPDAPAKKLLRLARDDDAVFAVREAARRLLGEKAEPPGDAPTFAGIPILSKRVIVLLDVSWGADKPLDVELMKTKSWREWRAVAVKDRDWVSQADWMKAETMNLVTELSGDARFDILLLNEDRVVAMSPKGMVAADERGNRMATGFVEEILPGGFTSQVQGFWEACRRAGSPPYGSEAPEDPAADTFILVSPGVPSGGALLYAPAIVDEFRRAWRFHRIRVHTVRVDDAAEPAEEVMKGIAEATGGTYVHKTKP